MLTIADCSRRCRVTPRVTRSFLPLDMLSNTARPGRCSVGQASPNCVPCSPNSASARARHLKRIAQLSARYAEQCGPPLCPLAPLRPWLSVMERAALSAVRPPELPPWRAQWRIWRGGKSLGRRRHANHSAATAARLADPAIEIGQCTGGERAFARQIFRRRAAKLASCGRRSAPAPKAGTARNSRSSAGTTMGRRRWSRYGRR